MNIPRHGKSVEQSEQTPSFQERVDRWLHACFTPEICADRIERNHRFLEEALELVQSAGCTQSEAHQLVDYVYGRDVGEMEQEIGGVMNTLAALCLAHGFDMMKCGDTELARCWTKIDKIRAKQKAKPKHSPLPEHTSVEQPGAAFVAALAAERDDLRETAEGLEKHADAETVRADAAEAGEAERDRLAALVYVPGRWRCAKCNFGLQQFKIRACDGAIGENDKTGEKCPNCDVPLWRVTEREAGNEISERAKEYLKLAVSAEGALAKAREALDEALVELRFVRKFICSSQQIQQPTGLGLYDECVAKVVGTIAEISASTDRATP
jgi:rubrerythrin